MDEWQSQVSEEHELLHARVDAMRAALGEETPEKKFKTLCEIARILGPDLELHLKKEEEVLFPALRWLAGKKAEGLDAIQNQHGQLRESFQRLATLLCQCGCAPAALAWNEIEERTRQFVRILEEHEEKERLLVLEVLEIGLQPDALVRLAKEMQGIVWRFREEGL